MTRMGVAIARGAYPNISRSQPIGQPNSGVAFSFLAAGEMLEGNPID
jgi:hypothetical protein